MKSRAGYWVGAGLIGLGLLGSLLWLVGSLVLAVQAVGDFQRVPAPGEATVRLEERKYVVYYEGDNANDVVPSIGVQIFDARTGRPLEI